MFNKNLKIGSTIVGDGCQTYIVAEISGNHNNSISKAKDLIRYAKEVGANAIKLQSYGPESITLNSEKVDFQIKSDSPWKDHSTLYNLFSKVAMPWSWHSELFSFARSLRIDIFSSPFCINAVNLLAECGTDAYKIASPEVYDFELIKASMRYNKPVIVSLGVANLRDIYNIVNIAIEQDFKNLILLVCSATYPAQKNELKLKLIQDIKSKFNCIVGFSDHTTDYDADVIAVAAGAQIIEKHICLDDDFGPDSFFSTKVKDFKKLIEKIRETELVLGEIDYEIPKNIQTDFRGRRSLYYSNNITSGSSISITDVRAIRPTYGLHPRYLNALLGKTLTKDVEIGDRVCIEDIKDVAYKVALIGLEEIKYLQNGSVNLNNIESHCSYLLDNKRFNIVCVIEKNYEKAQIFNASTGIPVFELIDKGQSLIEQADLIIFTASASDIYNKVVKLSILKGSRTYFFEPYLLHNKYELIKINSLCVKNEINAYVNYRNKNTPIFKKLRNYINKEHKLYFNCHYTTNNDWTEYLDLFLYTLNATSFDVVRISSDIQYFISGLHVLVLTKVEGKDNAIMTISSSNYEIFIDFTDGCIGLKKIIERTTHKFKLDSQNIFDYAGDEILRKLDGFDSILTSIGDFSRYVT